MKSKFKVGERYKVDSCSYESGNIIEITKVKGSTVYYKTIKGEKPKSEHFEIDSMFGRSLEQVHSKKSKFNVGDKVRAKNGALYVITTNGWEGIVKIIYGDGDINVDGFVVNPKYFEKVNVNETIVIYRKDNTMVALDKVTGEKAVAKCSLDDTFDYKVGAKLAFKRLMGEEEETGGNFKVLCVEDVRYGCCTIAFKTGKVYEYVNGHCKREDGSKSGNYADFAELIRCNPGYKGKLFEVKEVNRFAKPGEYVKVVHATGTCYEEYSNGDILRIVEEDEELNPNSMERAYYKNESKKYLDTCEYVVLEGDYPKEVEEPRYNGKIIFTDGDEVFETGRIYEVKDGKLKHPKYGRLLPGEGAFKNIEDIKDYFTACSKRKAIFGWSSKTLKLMEVKE